MTCPLGTYLRSTDPVIRAAARAKVWAAIRECTTPNTPATCPAVAALLGCSVRGLQEWVRGDLPRPDDLPDHPPLSAHRWTPGARHGNQNWTGRLNR